MLIAIYSLQTGLICEGKTFWLSSNLWPPRTKKNWQVNSCTFLNGSGHWIQLRLLFVREHKRYQENSKGIRFIVFASALNLLMSIFNCLFCIRFICLLSGLLVSSLSGDQTSQLFLLIVESIEFRNIIMFCMMRMLCFLLNYFYSFARLGLILS